MFYDTKINKIIVIIVILLKTIYYRIKEFFFGDLSRKLNINFYNITKLKLKLSSMLIEIRIFFQSYRLSISADVQLRKQNVLSKLVKHILTVSSSRTKSCFLHNSLKIFVKYF